MVMVGWWFVVCWWWLGNKLWGHTPLNAHFSGVLPLAASHPSAAPSWNNARQICTPVVVVELGLAFRLLMPLGRIGRGGCRRVGAGLKSGCVVVGLVLALPTVAVPCVDADERKHGG